MLVCTWDRCDTDGMVRRFIMVVCCLKKNQSTPRPSEHPPVMGEKVAQLFVVVVSHIQRIGCQPEKSTLHGGQSRSWSAEQGKKKEEKN